MAKVRIAEPKDAEILLALASSFATSFVVDPEAFRLSFAELLSCPEVYLAVAETDKAVVGYILGFSHPTFYANGHVAWVEEIFVREDCRKKGIGKLLLDSFERWSEEKGCRLVALATRRAADFYKALGYEESAVYFRKLLPRRG